MAVTLFSIILEVWQGQSGYEKKRHPDWRRRKPSLLACLIRAHSESQASQKLKETLLSRPPEVLGSHVWVTTPVK